MLIAVGIGTIAIMMLLVFLIFRHEIKKESKPRKRSMHDSAYGKDVIVTDAAADAAISSD